MKSKAVITVLLCVMAVTAIFIGSAAGAGGWFTTNITQAGAAPYGYFLVVQDSTQFTTPTTFYIDRSQGEGKAMLATALTALANSGSVYIYVDPVGQFGTCWSVWANK